MSMDVFGKIKEFIVRSLRDETFRTAMQTGSAGDRAQLMQANGYEFSQADFEAAALQMMEAKEQGHFDDLTDHELIAVFGSGVSHKPIPIRPGIKPWIVDDTYVNATIPDATKPCHCKPEHPPYWTTRPIAVAKYGAFAFPKH